MTDSRITRIVDQLVDLSDEEMQNLVEAINIKKTEKKKEKREKAIDAFQAAFYELDELGVGVLYYDVYGDETLLTPSEVFFQSR
jgi:hypothetical protein